MKNQKIYAQKENFGRCIALYLIKQSEGKEFAGTSVFFEELKEGNIYPSFLQIDRTQAQALIDQLWDCGLKPTEGSGSAGSLAATERHLADMQKLVFKGK